MLISPRSFSKARHSGARSRSGETVETRHSRVGQWSRRGGAHRVASKAEALTDVSRPEDGNRAARKAIDLGHLRRSSPQAATIKLADLIDNSVSIAAHDPAFAKVYLREKAALIEALGHGDAALLEKARAVLEESLAKLGLTDMGSPAGNQKEVC